MYWVVDAISYITIPCLKSFIIIIGLTRCVLIH